MTIFFKQFNTHISEFLQKSKQGTLAGLVIDISEPKTIHLSDNTFKELIKIRLRDDSGEIMFNLWDPARIPNISLFDGLILHDAYSKLNKYSHKNELNLQRTGKLVRIAYPNALAIPEAEKKFLLAIKRLTKQNLSVIDATDQAKVGLVITQNHITHLSIQMLGISVIPEEIGGLSALSYCNFANNHISQIPANLYQLEQLTEIILKWNRILDISPEIKRLQNLQTLDVSYNPITRLPDLIGILPNLTKFYINNTKLLKIPASIDVMQITNFSEKYPNIKNKEDLRALIELELILGRKIPPVDYVGKFTFGYVCDKGKLTQLGLYSQKLTTFPQCLLSLSHLSILNLSYNRLTTLPSLEERLPQLYKIYLSENLKLSKNANYLTFVQRKYAVNVTDSQESIQLAKLEYYFDEEIPYLGINTSTPVKSSEQFGYKTTNSQVSALYLKNKNLLGIPEEIASFIHLVLLDLSYNLITEINLPSLPKESLRKLILSGNQISNIPNLFESLPYLIELNLSYNHIHTVPLSVMQLSSCQILDFSFNRINSVPENWETMQHLKRYNLNGNPLKILPLTDIPIDQNRYTQIIEENLHNFQKLDINSQDSSYLALLFVITNSQLHLESEFNAFSSGITVQNGKITGISLTGKKLTFFPEVICHFSELRYLSLSRNNLEEIPESLGNLYHLQELYLNSNQITQLPISIANLKALQFLQLSDNKITELPYTISHLKHLSTIHLRNNQLTDFPFEIWRLEALKKIQLAQNPLNSIAKSYRNKSIVKIKQYCEQRYFFFEIISRKLEKNILLEEMELNHPKFCEISPLLEEKCKRWPNDTAQQILSNIQQKCFVKINEFHIRL